MALEPKASAGQSFSRDIAVYGEIDPNLVDGSSVWLISVCQVLASIDGVSIQLLLRRPLAPERRFLLEELEADDRIEIADAGRLGLLDPGAALDELERLDRERGPFELVVLRGQRILAEVAERDSFDGRLLPYVMTGRGMAAATLRLLADKSRRLLVQTETVAEELSGLIPGVDRSILILPPMIPDTAEPPPAAGACGDVLRLVYSGKLAPEYCWLETVDAFRALRRLEPEAELHVLGDKVHRPANRPDFHDEAMHSLRETDGLHWHGAVPRAAVNELLTKCDVALSIRDPSVEAARELSTKVLEYGAAGLPVVLNRAPAYERLLGSEYPLFLDGADEAVGVLTGPARDPGARAAAAAACHAASREFMFSRIAMRLAEQLPQGPVASTPSVAPRPDAALSTSPASSNGAARPITVLIAGHDFKFTRPPREAIAAAGGTVLEDPWKNHVDHDEAISRAALEKADVIHCEWCLGNAAWYSRNKRPGQRLLIRLYRVEVYSDYPAAVDMANVDQIAFDSQHILEEAIERFGWDPAKLTVIPNGVDADRLRCPKQETARHTLAMVGYIPRRKRLDRALDILEQLRREDPRFRLILIGHPPSELRWVARDSDEIEFFRECFVRIQSTEMLRGAVFFKPFTGDVPAFFQQAGFVLSTSDSEGHQVALAEGTASGAIPVIIDRPGAHDQYPPHWIHARASEAASAIRIFEEDFKAKSAEAADHADHWSLQKIWPRWIDSLSLSNGAEPIYDTRERNR